MVKQMRIGAGHDGGDADELTGDSGGDSYQYISYPNRYCTWFDDVMAGDFDSNDDDEKSQYISNI